MNAAQIECMPMLNAIENFVSDFNRETIYANFGPELGQTFINSFGVNLSEMGAATEPLDCFYKFIVKVKFMPGDAYAQVNKVFNQYYQGALNF